MSAEKGDLWMLKRPGRGIEGLVAMSFALASQAMAMEPLPRTTIMAKSNDIPQRGAGLFYKLEPPCLSDQGQVLFNGTLLSIGPVETTGMFRSNGDRSQIETVIFQGDRAPDNNGVFRPNNSDPLQTNASSKFSVGMGLNDTLDGNFDNLGLFLDGGQGEALIQVARGNQYAPNRDGQFLAKFGSPASLNDSDQVAFIAELRGTAAGNSDNFAIYRYTDGDLEELVRKGDRNPSNNGFFTNLNPGAQGVAINALGEVVFVGESRTDSPSELFGGLYVMDGDDVDLFVRDGDRSPDRNGFFRQIRGTAPAFGDGGNVAFRGSLIGTSLGSLDDTGVFRADRDEVVTVSRENDKVPDGNGRFADFGAAMAVNRGGSVLFHASLSGATGSSTNGVFVGDGTSVRTVARVNDPAPGIGRFIGFDQTIGAINDEGHVLFLASINLENGGSTNDTSGLFVLHPEYGMLEVARRGDFLGSVGLITSININTGLGLTGLSSGGFNQSGQVAYRCEAAGEVAVARWSPPRDPVISSISLSDGNVVIAWPSFFEEAFLESRDGLSGEGRWKEVLKSPVLTDGYYETTLPVDEGYEFYRLNDPSSDPVD